MAKAIPLFMRMGLIFFSFFAGMLTVLAPCVLPILPIIIGGSLADQDKKRPFIVTASLAVSIVIFTLLIKSTASIIAVPDEFWKFFSGGIILIFGIFTAFPKLWDSIEIALGLGNRSQNFLNQSGQKKGYLGSVLVGMSLGPVFSSCSPTYVLILATVLPQSFSTGIIYLLSYAFGLAFVLLGIALFGQRLIGKMRWAADPHGKFKNFLGILFILVGIAILSGFDKNIETFFVENSLFDVSKIETKFLR